MRHNTADAEHRGARISDEATTSHAARRQAWPTNAAIQVDVISNARRCAAMLFTRVLPVQRRGWRASNAAAIYEFSETMCFGATSGLTVRIMCRHATEIEMASLANDAARVPPSASSDVLVRPPH